MPSIKDWESVGAWPPPPQKEHSMNGELKASLQDSERFNLSASYQLWQDQTSWYAHSGKRDAMELAYLALGVAGEAGEVADQAKKMLRVHGDDAMDNATEDDLVKLIKELGDTQWYITRFCTMLGITTQELILFNMIKLHDRMKVKWRAETNGGYEWPLKDLTYDDALKLTQHIESHITQVSASPSTDTDT